MEGLAAGRPSDMQGPGNQKPPHHSTGKMKQQMAGRSTKRGAQAVHINVVATEVHANWAKHD